MERPSLHRAQVIHLRQEIESLNAKQRHDFLMICKSSNVCDSKAHWSYRFLIFAVSLNWGLLTNI